MRLNIFSFQLVPKLFSNHVIHVFFFFFFSIICVTKAASKFIYIQPQPPHLVHVIRLSVIKIQLFVLKQYSIVCNSLHLVEGELIKNSNNNWFYLITPIIFSLVRTLQIKNYDLSATTRNLVLINL